MEQFKIRCLQEPDREWVRQFIVEHWFADNVIVHGKVYYPAELPGFSAALDGKVVGLVTYHIDQGSCELVSLDSLAPGQGIGTALIQAVREAALQQGCQRIWLITTNDNLNALRFYQKRGFYLSVLYPDAVTLSRKIKPGIPLYGEDGIPIRDEIELRMEL